MAVTTRAKHPRACWNRKASCVNVSPCVPSRSKRVPSRTREVDSNILRQRNIGGERLLQQSKIFGERFRLVNTDEPTKSYESKKSFQYGKKRSEVFHDLCELYDSSLLACDRSFIGNRLYLVLSKRPNLLSHEAVTFAVMHHLSNLVRYRPSDAERLLDSPRGWLLRSWVDRASETFLLNMASRLTGEDHVMT